jgi:hypothetical protein
VNRYQIENIYEANGLTDYKLKTTEDILKCHGIDYKAVAGYDGLDDINRAIYGKFILNIFNAWGLESRATLIPKGIYFVEDTDFLVKENPEDDYYNVAGGEVVSIDRNGSRELLHKWVDDDYTDLPIIVEEPKQYLRFEYEHQGRTEWLHVVKEGREWY